MSQRRSHGVLVEHRPTPPPKVKVSLHGIARPGAADPPPPLDDALDFRHMARPEPGVRPEPSVEPPPIDPSEAIHHAYRFHRAKRRARVEHRRRTREAGLRFYVILVVLVFLTVVLGLTIWNEIQRLFGL